MTGARRASLAPIVLMLTALATSACGAGKAYVVSADYANSMNDSAWRFKHIPEAPSEPKPPADPDPDAEPAAPPAE